jgi:hypothetical protein
MSGRDLVLAQGIAAARAGDRQAARRLLAEAAQRDPGSELAWLWLSGVLDTTQGRSFCLQRALEINPTNEIARRGLQALEEARATRALVVQATAPGPGGAGGADRTLPASPPVAAAHRPAPGDGEKRQWAGGAWAATRKRVTAGLAAVTAVYRRVTGTGEKRWRAGVAWAAARLAAITTARRRAPGVAEKRQWAGVARTTARLAAITAARRRTPGAGEKRRRAGRDILAKPRFWQVLISCLAVVALGLVAVLLYTTLGQAAPADGRLAGAAVAVASPSPHGTLRPTFTATATHTATAIPSPTRSPTPSATPTPTATPLPMATATATSAPAPQPVLRRAVAAPTAVPSAAPAPRPTLQPRSWDPRLDALRVRIEPVGIAEGQKFWRLVEARWADEVQSCGKHSIYVEVLDFQGRRAVGQPVIVQWADGSVALTVVDRPAPDWGVDFGMYNCLGSYAVSVGGAPSDRIVGLGLGTPERPNFTIHTSFYLVFRLAQR